MSQCLEVGLEICQVFLPSISAAIRLVIVYICVCVCKSLYIYVK